LLERGANVAIVFGLTLPVVIGGAGMGVETSYWYLRHAQLQAAADAAAYAGAIEKRAGHSNSVVTSAATTIASQNSFDPGAGTITVHSPPTSGSHENALAVEVLLDEPVQRFFTAWFDNSQVVEHVRAVAAFKSTGNACILALDPSASKSVLFAGNTGVNIKGCDVMTNSVATDAIKTQGSSITSAGCFISAGGVNDSGGTVNLACAAPVTTAPPVGDPFASLPVPTDNGNCKNGNGATLQPGNYCSGLTLKNNVTLKPGTYIISGGDFQVNANANVTGSGVTIYLTGTSRISMNGNSTTTLSAPTSGTYAGILFFGDRTNYGTTNNTINGTNASKLTGYIYAPTQPVNYLGNFSGQNGCTRVVADTIQWSGNTTVDDTQNCGQFGLQEMSASQLISMVE
jgi:hypothetical protein